MNWDKVYYSTLKNICEADAKNFPTIIEIEEPKFESELIINENAKGNALYGFKLDDRASVEDKEKFVKYIYGYIGENFNNIVDKEKEVGEGDESMTEKNIKELLKRYGAEDKEIENFMKDLAEMKDDIEDITEAQKDEEQGIKDYQEMKDTNNDNADDEDLEEIKQDESKHNDYLLNAENVKLLKATEEGKDLIMNAPNMAKEELEKAIKKYLESVKK